MKIKHLFGILLVTLSFSIEAFAKIETFNLTIDTGRLISFEIVRAQNSKLPTFLFLPGVNRGLLASDEALETLSSLGYGIVTMNFSTQPISVSALPKGVKPHFRNNIYKLDDLNTEVHALSNELKKSFNVKTIIPVSISFSSAVSSTLKNFPLIVDAVPMTSSAAVNPELEAYITYLKSAEIFNPIFGPGISRTLLDQAYAQKWGGQVDAIVDEFELNKERRSDMIEGYSVFSRASERFVWDLKNTAPETRRVFIFAKNDSPTLLKDQLELFLKAMDSTPNALAFIVNNSGHVVSSDQPAAYAGILNSLVAANLKNISGIFEVNPGSDKMKFFTGAEAKKYIKNLINTL
ncbi:MAG: hypothetical protein HOP07_17350 [Bacteriovoracaceae bacterium]|nr:hypothetical protein [Bacteriovoracaceae bacterium]